MKFRKIDPRIWNDAKFMALSDNAKLVFFLLLSHPHQTSLGAMRATLPGLAAELGWTEKIFREAFSEVLSKGMVKHDERASILWLPNFIRYNRPESPNVVKAWVSAADLLPECPQKFECLQAVKVFLEGFPKAFTEALPEGFGKDYVESGAGAGANILGDKPRKIGKENGAPLSPESRLFTDWFSFAFEKVQGYRYIFEGAKDGKILSGLLKNHTWKELVSKSCHFLTDRNRFPQNRAPSISFFATKINDYPPDVNGKAEDFRTMGLLPPEGIMLEDWRPWQS